MIKTCLLLNRIPFRIMPAFPYWLCFLMVLSVSGFRLQGQSLSFDLKQSAQVNFTFSSIQNYQAGLVVPNAASLRIIADNTNWDLYVGATTIVPGQWDVEQTYSVNGNLPNIDIARLRFRNGANTQQVSGFFNLTDISNPVYIIGSSGSDPAFNCPQQGTNTPGNYISQPQCYQFQVDIRIVPGLGMRPGLYSLRIDYILINDL